MSHEEDKNTALISELIIARISGKTYPNAEIENKLFREYFNTPHFFQLGDLFFIKGTYKDQPNKFIAPYSHLVSTELEYAYTVLQINANKEITSDIKLFKTSKKYTNVILKGLSNSKMCNLLNSSDCLYNESYLNMISSSTSLSRLYSLPPMNVLNANFYHSFEKNFSNEEDSDIVEKSSYSKKVPSEVLEYAKTINFNYLDQAVDQVYRVLSVPFSLKNVEVSLKLQLLRDPVLFNFGNNSSIEDMQNVLQICAQKLGVNYVQTDSRVLWNYPQKPKIPNIYPTIWETFIQSNTSIPELQNSFLSDPSAGLIVQRKSPCILHINSLDWVFQDPTMQQERLDDCFAKGLKRFLEDLNEVLMTKLNNNEDNQSCATTEDILSDCTVVVVVTASLTQLEQMKPSLRSIFPSATTLRMGLNPNQVSRIIQDSSTSDVKPEIFELLEKHAIALGSSHSLTSMWTNEVQLTALQRTERVNWLENYGINELLQNPNNVDMNESKNLEVKEIDLKNTVHRIPLLQISENSRDNANINPVRWEDIGGLERVRKEIMEVLELPLQFPHLFPIGSPKRQGVLLYGPPGTGKTLVARAVATECDMAFLSVKGPELLDAYVGESEKNVREIFKKARDLAPCVLFFDEIDSLAPARARNSDSGGGVMDRIVSQLLTEMDLLALHGSSTSTRELQLQHRVSPKDLFNGSERDYSEFEGFSSSASGGTREEFNLNLSSDLSKETYLSEKFRQKFIDFLSDRNGGEIGKESDRSVSVDYNDERQGQSKQDKMSKFVFVIGATNRPDLLDPALLRPGRFDRKIYLGACKDIKARIQILQAQTRKFTLADDVDLEEIAKILPNSVTGAEIGGVTSAAFSKAMEEKIKSLTELAIKSIREDEVLLNESSIINMNHQNEVKKDLFNDFPVESWKIRSYINNLADEMLIVRVKQRDLIDSAREMRPSNVDLKYYESLDQQYNDLPDS